MSEAAAKPGARSLPPVRPPTGTLALSLRPAAAGVAKPRAAPSAARGRAGRRPSRAAPAAAKAPIAVKAPLVAAASGGGGEASDAAPKAREPRRKANDDVRHLGASHGRFPGSKKRLRWSQEQDDGLLRFVEEVGTNWPLIRGAWQKAGLDSEQVDDGEVVVGAPVGVRSVAALRQRYYLLVGRRPGKKAPPRRKTLDRWEVEDDMDLLQFIEEGGEGFGAMGTVESSCASLSKSLNTRPGRAMRTDMSVYNRVRRLAMKEGVSIYEFLGLLDATLANDTIPAAVASGAASEPGPAAVAVPAPTPAPAPASAPAVGAGSAEYVGFANNEAS